MSPATMNDPRLAFDVTAHAYTLGGQTLPSVTQILAAQGIGDFSAPYFTQDVKDRGRAVHTAIAADIAGTLDDGSLEPDILRCVEGWRLFQVETGATVDFWEQPVCDPTAGYAGTLDGVIVTDHLTRPRRTVLDVKRALYVSAGPQIAAYRRCAYDLYDAPVVLHRAALVLPGDGSYKLHPFDAPEHQHDERVFLHACFLYHWRVAHACAA